MRRTTVDDYDRRILRAQQYLDAHLDEVVVPAELARVAAFSLHHFHRIFRARLGETVMQHVRRLRLERAARRMRGCDATLLALALDAGYESHEAFTRAFIERFGVAPSVYRDQPPARLAAWQRRRDDVPVAPVTVETFPARRVLFMRHRGSYATIGAHWQRLVTWAGGRGLLAQPAPLYGVCPDDPEVTPEAHLRFDACVTAGDDVEPDGEVGVAVLPAGTYAVGLHVGPYARLAETYLDVIGRWFPGSGHEPAPDAVIEHYRNDPSTAPPERLETEVRVRIAT